MANNITFKMGVDGSGMISGVESAFKSAALKARILGDAIMASVKGAMNTAMSNIGSSINTNAARQSAEATFDAFTHSAEKTQAIMAALTREAFSMRLDPAQTLEAGKMLMLAADGSQKKLMELVKTSEILAALNPAEGLQGAAYALREATADDFISIQERFNIPRNVIKELRAEGLQGADVVAGALKRMGVGSDLVDRQTATWTRMKAGLNGLWQEAQRVLGMGVFQQLSNGMDSLLKSLEGGGFDTITAAAKNIGAQIGEFTLAVINAVKSLYAWLGETYDTAMLVFQTVSNFISGLPARLAAAWNNGALVQGVVSLLGGLMMVAWDALKGLAKMAMNGILNGVPTLILTVLKILSDALRGAFGERLSKMLGLDKGGEAIAKQLDTKAKDFSDRTVEIGKDFASSAKERFAALGLVGGDFVGNTLGGNDALALARRQQASRGPSFMERMQADAAIARQQRLAQENAQAARDAAEGQSAKPKAVDPKQLEKARKEILAHENALIAAGNRPIRIQSPMTLHVTKIPGAIHGSRGSSR